MNGKLYNGERLALDDVPVLNWPAFAAVLAEASATQTRLAALFGVPALSGATVRLYAVLAHDASNMLQVMSVDVKESFPSLTPQCPQAHRFEREIAEQCGVAPAGHPWLKPIRYPRGAAGSQDYFRVDGEELHEVAVGPVHAGVIEPGHFRFQCHGEDVLNLEISLGYQHRGVERWLAGGPGKRTVHVLETVAGDSSVAHATAYSQLLEALSATKAPPRAQALRGIALELERMANHTGDLGALAGDVGFLPALSYCGRLRGDFLNLTALICGSRLGRGLVRPGGVGPFDVDAALVAAIVERLERAMADLTGAVELLWGTPSVLARFEGTGAVSRADCQMLGLVGPAARACGLERDVRNEHPAGIYRFAQVPVTTWHTGDVFARAYVRWQELRRSAAFVREQIAALPEGPLRVELAPLAPSSVAVALVEGWRGEVCHVVLTDESGRFARYKIVDPSFHNWPALELALRGGQIADFPLCNKSFNLSYCGHDL